MNARMLRELGWVLRSSTNPSEADKVKADLVMRRVADLVQECDDPKADHASKAKALYYFNKALKELK